IISEMRSEGLEGPSLIMYNKLIDTSFKSGLRDMAFVFFDELIKQGLKPGIDTFNILLKSFIRARELDKGLSLYSENKKIKLKPDEFTFSTLFSLCGRAKALDKAEELFEEMKKEGIASIIAYNSLIDTSIEARNREKALFFLEEME